MFALFWITVLRPLHVFAHNFANIGKPLETGGPKSFVLYLYFRNSRSILITLNYLEALFSDILWDQSQVPPFRAAPLCTFRHACRSSSSDPPIVRRSRGASTGGSISSGGGSGGFRGRTRTFRAWQDHTVKDMDQMVSFLWTCVWSTCGSQFFW